MSDPVLAANGDEDELNTNGPLEPKGVVGIVFAGKHVMEWRTDDGLEQQIDKIMMLAEDWSNARHNFVISERSLRDDERLFATKQALRQALWAFHAWHVAICAMAPSLPVDQGGSSRA